MASETLTPDPTLLIATTTSGIFCRPECSSGSIENKPERTFSSVRDALSAGFRPCSRCKPLHSGIEDPPWLELLMEMVEKDPARRWHDQDLHGENMDPATVRRWFIANHGLTFHAYTRLRRLGLALRQIQHGAAVSKTVLALGYESERGFREAFSQVFGNPPSAVDRQSCIWINRIATPLGSMIMGVSDQGLCLLEFAERRMLDTQLRRLHRKMGRVFLPGDHPLMQQVKSELDDYFNNKLRQFTVAIEAPGTEFQESVWQALLRIPYGEMRSYAAIAKEIGQAGAMRAVGRANGDNRIAIIIPCHRVIGSDGELTGYAGGLWRKKYLLSLEQAQSFRLS